MFAYCNNNPINFSDEIGERPLAVALDLFAAWCTKKGESQYFDNQSSVAKKLKKSKKMKAVVENEIQKYENGEDYGSGTVKFDSHEPDLWLGVRNASYEMVIKKETKEVGFWLFKSTKKRYVAQIKVFDIYNFNIGNETGDGVGSLLNNIGYLAQEHNIGAEYYWEVNYEFATKWK